MGITCPYGPSRHEKRSLIICRGATCLTMEANVEIVDNFQKTPVSIVMMMERMSTTERRISYT